MYLDAVLSSLLVPFAAAVGAALLAPFTAAAFAAFLALLSAPSGVPLSWPRGAPAADATRPIDEIVLKVSNLIKDYPFAEHRYSLAYVHWLGTGAPG